MSIADEWAIREDPESLSPVCPANYDILPERIVISGAEGYQLSVPICQARSICPVKNLLPISDPVAQEHEAGKYATNPDMDHVSETVKTGVTCITQRETRSVVSSGFRPQAYQDHLREVWDKWTILKKDQMEACKKVKKEVEQHIIKHRMVRQPGTTSNHTMGNAVDIGGVSAASADKTAKSCNMFRPYSDDAVHFQPVDKVAPR